MAKKPTPGAPAAEKPQKSATAPKPKTPPSSTLVVFVLIGLMTIVMAFAALQVLIQRGGLASQPTAAAVTQTVPVQPTSTLVPATATQAPTASPTATPKPATATAAVITQTAAPTGYPLASQEYTSPQGEAYNAEWDANGWLHQPNLPAGPERIAHELSFTIQPGNYAFNGVECQLFLDEARQGDGGKPSVGYGNGLPFTVSTADGREAWARVACRASEAGGFSIEWKLWKP